MLIAIELVYIYSAPLCNARIDVGQLPVAQLLLPEKEHCTR